MRRHARGGRNGANAGLKRISNMLMKSSSPAGRQGPNEEVLNKRVLLLMKRVGRQAPPRLRISTSTSARRTRREGKMALLTFMARMCTYVST